MAKPAIFYTDQEMDRKIIAIDLGTSQCKTVAFNAKGNVLAEFYKSYPTYSDNSNIFEQDPRAWWNAVTETLNEVSDKVLVKNEFLVAEGFNLPY